MNLRDYQSKALQQIEAASSAPDRLPPRILISFAPADEKALRTRRQQSGRPRLRPPAKLLSTNMIRVMRDQSAPVERRDEMAKAAAPYVHPRLAAVEYAGTTGSKPANEMSDEELMAIIREGQAKEAEERKPSN
jgi:hypothetical protein